MEGRRLVATGTAHFQFSEKSGVKSENSGVKSENSGVKSEKMGVKSEKMGVNSEKRGLCLILPCGPAGRADGPGGPGWPGGRELRQRGEGPGGGTWKIKRFGRGVHHALVNVPSGLNFLLGKKWCLSEKSGASRKILETVGKLWRQSENCGDSRKKVTVCSENFCMITATYMTDMI